MLRESKRFPIGHWHGTDHKLVYDVLSDGGRVRFEDELELDQTAKDQWQIKIDDPLSAVASCEREIELIRNSWHIRIHAQSEMRCDAEQFYLTNRVVAHEGGEVVFRRDWESTIPREGC